MISSASLQRDNPNWQALRKYRLTASNWHAILEGDKKQKLIKLQRRRSTLIQRPDFWRKSTKLNEWQRAAIDWGVTHEDRALGQVSKAIGRDLVPAPFIQSYYWSFLGASPDAYITDVSGKKIVGCVEIKCPYSKAGSGDMPPYIIVDRGTGLYKVKTDSAVYMQIQAQLYCAGLRFAVLGVWTTKKLYICRVKICHNFLRYVVRRLVDIYLEYYVPFLDEKNLIDTLTRKDIRKLLAYQKADKKFIYQWHETKTFVKDVLCEQN